MTQVVGYTRPLLDEPDDAEQLRGAGAHTVVQDDPWPSRGSSPRLVDTVADLRRGDVLVVSSGVRLASSVGSFISTMARLAQRGVAVRVLDEPALSTRAEPVDPGEMFRALEGLKRSLISLRTRRGMALAARSGRRAGRPSVMTAEMTAIARELRAQQRTLAHIAGALGVSPGAVSRALKRPPSAAVT